MNRQYTHRGQASLELLLALLVLIPLFFGGWELARGISLRQALDSGADLAAQALSLDPTDTQYADWVIHEQVRRSALCPGCADQVQWCVAVESGQCVTPSPSTIPTDFGTNFVVQACVPFTPSVPLAPLAPTRVCTSYFGKVEQWR